MKPLEPKIKRCLSCNHLYSYALDSSDSSPPLRESSFNKSLAYCPTCHEEMGKIKGYLNYLKRFGDTSKQQRENFRKLNRLDKVRIAVTCWFPQNKCINCGIIVDFSERLQFTMIGRYGKAIFACSEKCWDEYQFLWWKSDLCS